MNVAIITGVSGQDGAYLAQLLVVKGYKVIGLSRGYNNNKFERLDYLEIRDKIVIEECDLLDLSGVINVFKKYLPAEIYNLSAQSSVGISFDQPIGTIQYNITSVLNILEAIRILDLPAKFYQASSSEMFGKVRDLPITLNTPMHPVSPYAISKATAYWTCINYRESYQMFICNGILFNHESYLRSPNFFIKKVISESIKIKQGFSTHLKVGNIDIKRDFGFAPKYVEAMWLSLQREIPYDYIICSGTSVSLRSVIEHIFEVLNIDKTKIVEDSTFYRPNEIDDSYGSNQAARELLGWHYDVSFYEVLDILIKEELTNNKSNK